MKIVATIGVFIILEIAAALLFIYSGIYNVAATDPHTQLEYFVLNTTMENSVRRHAQGIAAPSFSDSMVNRGLEHFRDNCVTCHGAPGVGAGAIGKGITPSPPDLAEEAKDWAAQELFWIIKHGIKMSGMPAWGPTHKDEELWAIVAFVRQLPELSPEDYQAMIQAAEDSTGKQAGPAVTVTMTNDLRFSPERVEVTVGQTVEWKNTSELPHTVTADPEKAADKEHVKLPEGAQTFNSGFLQPGDVFRHTFKVSGEYRYFCIPHEMAGMVATVIVKPQ